jgi:hypothetical protein
MLHEFDWLEISGQSMETSDEDVETWWRPVWETEEEVEPPGHPRRAPMEVAAADYAHPLLAPLATAQDAVTRLEARTEAAQPAVAEGLRARLAYREAAGWLSYARFCIHPRDLALRDARITGSYGAAALAGRLEAELPATTAQGYEFDVAPSDLAADQALRFAHLWRRLAEFRTWRPLENTETLRETLQFLGCSKGITDAEIEEWVTSAELMRERAPALIRAGRLAREWMNRAQVTESLTVDGIFFAACQWRQSGFGRTLALPFWLAPEQRLNGLATRIGIEWVAGFLGCVAEAATSGLAELNRLQAAADKRQSLGATSRSKLPAAFDAVLRAPVITAGGLAKTLEITPQAALGLLRHLLEAGIVREATGRASWRAFVLS